MRIARGGDALMHEATLLQRLAGRLARVAAVLRTVAGAPDYERYVAHMRTRHPGTAPLSAGDFLAERQRERFEKPGGRCC